MRRVIRFALLFLTLPATAQSSPLPLTSAAAAPCEAIAIAARRVSPAAWAKEEGALAPTLRIAVAWPHLYPPEAPADPLEAKLLALPEVIDAIGISGMAGGSVEHVPGTELYEAFTIAGTIHEQTVTFIRAQAGGAAKLLASPRSASGGQWTTSEDLGEVGGRAFIVDHGRNDATGLDQDIQLTPWLGTDWGPACRVALTFRSAYPVTKKGCGDGKVCALAASIAGQVARKFDRGPWGDGEFQFGPTASIMAQAAAKRVKALDDDDRPDFPELGRTDAVVYPWSGTDFTPFPLVLGGRSYLAIIGHEGIAWRSSSTILLAIFEPGVGKLKPLAGIVVERRVASLAQARVLAPKLDQAGP
jgi:hypothetical protein